MASTFDAPIKPGQRIYHKNVKGAEPSAITCNHQDCTQIQPPQRPIGENGSEL